MEVVELELSWRPQRPSCPSHLLGSQAEPCVLQLRGLVRDGMVPKWVEGREIVGPTPLSSQPHGSDTSLESEVGLTFDLATPWFCDSSSFGFLIVKLE